MEPVIGKTEVKVDKVSGVMFREGQEESLVPGNLIHESVDFDPEDTQDGRSWRKGFLVQRWLNAAKYFLLSKTNLALTWPEITEDDARAVIKSEIIDKTKSVIFPVPQTPIADAAKSGLYSDSLIVDEPLAEPKPKAKLRPPPKRKVKRK